MIFVVLVTVVAFRSSKLQVPYMKISLKKLCIKKYKRYIGSYE